MKSAYTKYISGLILFGLNGIVSSKILMSSYEIVFFRTLIGSAFLAVVYFLFSRVKILRIVDADNELGADGTCCATLAAVSRLRLYKH